MLCLKMSLSWFKFFLRSLLQKLSPTEILTNQPHVSLVFWIQTQGYGGEIRDVFFELSQSVIMKSYLMHCDHKQ